MTKLPSAKRIALTFAKVLALLFPVGVVALQLPELSYDLGSRTPTPIAGPEDLKPELLGKTTFAAVTGRADPERAFVYSTHGLAYSYFNLKGYGPRLLVRTYGPMDKNWPGETVGLGRLKRYGRMPFSNTVSRMYRDRFGEDIPADAMFLAHQDVPALSGWQIGALVFGVLLLAVMFYGFFIWRGKLRGA